MQQGRPTLGTLDKKRSEKKTVKVTVEASHKGKKKEQMCCSAILGLLR